MSSALSPSLPYINKGTETDPIVVSDSETIVRSAAHDNRTTSRSSTHGKNKRRRDLKETLSNSGRTVRSNGREPNENSYDSTVKCKREQSTRRNVTGGMETENGMIDHKKRKRNWKSHRCSKTTSSFVRSKAHSKNPLKWDSKKRTQREKNEEEIGSRRNHEHNQLQHYKQHHLHYQQEKSHPQEKKSALVRLQEHMNRQLTATRPSAAAENLTCQSKGRDSTVVGMNGLSDSYNQPLRSARRGTLSLTWNCTQPHTLLDSEMDLLRILMSRKKAERGMMRDQPRSRVKQVRNICRKYRIPVSQACSLRRHHVKFMNNYTGYHALGLGSDLDIRESAAKFEGAVESYLRRNDIEFVDEKTQREHHRDKCLREGTVPLQATPDFLLKEPVKIECERQFSSPGRKKMAHICWIEAKMFYGASSIPTDSKTAVGNILPKMERYVDLYGPGAIVFAYGCGKDLACELARRGVLVLDASPLDLRQVEAHQRKWCADKDGSILP